MGRDHRGRLTLATKGLRSKFSVLRISDGVLLGRSQPRWKGVGRLCFPNLSEKPCLEGCHGGAGSGQLGTSKTLSAEEGVLLELPNQSHAPLQQQASGGTDGEGRGGHIGPKP